MLNRFLNWVFASQLRGVTLADPEPWEISTAIDAASFLRALPTLPLDHGVILFEGTTSRVVANWLRKHAQSEGLEIRPGTILPASDFWHLPLHVTTVEDLAALVETQAVSMPAIHLHVYEGSDVVLEWYDAFDEPLWLSRRLDRAAAEQFAKSIHGTLSIAKREQPGT
jgi:hypothetical protein